MRWYKIPAVAIVLADTVSAELGSARRLQDSLEIKTQPFAEGNHLLPLNEIGKVVNQHITRRSWFDKYIPKKRVKDDCDVMFAFPTIAYPNYPNFALDFHAVGFRRRIDGYNDNETGDRKQTVLNRISTFLSGPATGSIVYSDVTLARSDESVTNRVMGKIGPDGHLESPLELVGVQPGDRVTFASTVKSESGNLVADKMEVIVAGEEGFGIISDIDDTIKETNVLSKVRVVVETLYNDYRPVQAMDELFKNLKGSLKVTTSSGISEPLFYYLSASPWQLFFPLSSFLRRFFPPGELVLNKLNFADVDSVRKISDLERYKIENAKSIFAKFPHRKFILVGDSGQKDPEIYGQLFREHQDQVACILIRKLGSINAKIAAKLHSGKRFTSALQGVPRNRWYAFDHASALTGVDFKTTCPQINPSHSLVLDR